MWEIVVRSKLQPLLSDCLRSERCKARLGREWVSQGRQAPPRMLFYFATCPAGESKLLFISFLFLHFYYTASGITSRYFVVALAPMLCSFYMTSE